MAWSFDNLVKGQVTQAILHTVLEQVGYRVCRSGIEELLPELRGSEGDGLRCRLPMQLRTLPDFLVINPETNDLFLTEVKFRSRLTPETIHGLWTEIEHRRQFWPDLVTVIMIGEAATNRGYHQDHVRAIPWGFKEQEFSDHHDVWKTWEALPQLQEVFRRIRGNLDHQKVVDSITQSLRDLSKLQRETETWTW